MILTWMRLRNLVQLGCSLAHFSATTAIRANWSSRAILKTRGFHKKLVLTKSDVFAELKRRVPNIQANRKTRVNLNNTKIYGLMQKLLEYPLSDPEDILFIKSEFLKWETTFDGMAQTNSSDGSRMTLTFEDRLRFIHILANVDEVRAEYLRSTDGKNRASVDYQKSDKAPCDWKELLCDMFNDEDEVYETKPFPDLHDKFRNSITLDKGSIELTPDKCKTIMADYKKKVLETVRKYNLSGNGSDMAVFEDDAQGKSLDVFLYIFHIYLFHCYSLFLCYKVREVHWSPKKRMVGLTENSLSREPKGKDVMIWLLLMATTGKSFLVRLDQRSCIGGR